MITFRRMSIIDRLLLLLPSRKRAYDRDMLDAMTRLINNPFLPCEIDGRVIPHGFGSSWTSPHTPGGTP